MSEIIINPKLIDLIHEKGLDKDATLTALFTYLYCDNRSILLDAGVLDENLQDHLRLHFLNRDFETQAYVARTPLFVSAKEGDYREFIENLINQGLTSNGMPTNPIGYTVFTDDDETEKAFNELKLKAGSHFDLHKLTEIVTNYYSHVDKPKGLIAYLRSSAYVDLRNGNTYMVGF